MHVSHADPENPVAPAPAGTPGGIPVSAPSVADPDASFRSTSSVDPGKPSGTPAGVKAIRKILSQPAPDSEPTYGTLGSPPRGAPPPLIGVPMQPGPPPGPPPPSAFRGSPAPVSSAQPEPQPEPQPASQHAQSGLKSSKSVSTQTDVVGPVAYMQYMADASDGTIASHPEITCTNFMSDVHMRSAATTTEAATLRQGLEKRRHEGV
jgi:hypothetical protein